MSSCNEIITLFTRNPQVLIRGGGIVPKINAQSFGVMGAHGVGLWVNRGDMGYGWTRCYGFRKIDLNSLISIEKIDAVIRFSLKNNTIQIYLNFFLGQPGWIGALSIFVFSRPESAALRGPLLKITVLAKIQNYNSSFVAFLFNIFPNFKRKC